MTCQITIWLKPNTQSYQRYEELEEGRRRIKNIKIKNKEEKSHPTII